MAFYCNGKNGVCDCHPVCKSNCEYFDGSGGKHINTNADRIRAMSDEDIAEHLIQYRDDCGDYCTPNCEFYDTYEEAKKATLEWLKQPADMRGEEDG